MVVSATPSAGSAAREGASRLVPVIVGPTSSGKTAVALAIADLLPVEIISADSRQVYRYLDIGTAKPSAAERARVPHHFIDIIDPDEEFSAGRFGDEGRRVIDVVFARGRTPVIVGGSGLYIKSLVDGLFEGPGADPEFRDALQARLDRGELGALVEELHRVDPEAARRIDPTKPRRVVRALEVHHVTGRPLSDLQTEQKIRIDFEALFFGLKWERQELYDRINRRCDAMLSSGLVDEAAALERRGFSRSLNALNTVGYKEAFAFLHGEIAREEMLSQFSQNSRRYAKRQMTWFRRDARVRWLQMGEEFSANELAEVIARECVSPA